MCTPAFTFATTATALFVAAPAMFVWSAIQARHAGSSPE
jgi:biopolymer transport protein ExbB/TolQ